MEVHGCCNRDIGDRHPIAGKPGPLPQTVVEDTGELVEVVGLASKHGRVRLVAEQRFHAVLDQVDIAGRKP